MHTLGIIGNRQDLASSDIEALLELIAEDCEIGALNLQQEGYTSIHAEAWADSKGLTAKTYPASWVRDGKRATLLRDAAIVRDSTAYLILSGPRSERPRKLAEQLARAGRPVFHLPAKSRELEELTSPQVPDRKACKETSHSPQLTLEQVGLSKSR